MPSDSYLRRIRTPADSFPASLCTNDVGTVETTARHGQLRHGGGNADHMSSSV
ncbi:hypothetical protein JVT61DRAFT_6389 [Boletus reticuloceps]|uniref:Uncharacterized protein n=1 Tax=Boletus reticuloceps TaxID=495285 RepID=A0A8I3A8Q3_9AGAM|nr:hypothetical protein JVT61DRAFT_6389 [Boletus reticuloceps]